MSREIWAVVSDLHCGSTLGLIQPQGVQLDDGGWYHPSTPQMALWGCWEEYWAEVKSKLKAGDRLFVAINGDLVDGDHHQTTQIVSRNMAATQHEIAMAVLGPAMALDPKRFVVIRGTEAHVGKSAQFEERIAKDLGAVANPKLGTYSQWHFQALSEGVLMDFAHHGSVGKLPHTRSNPAKTLAVKMIYSAAKHKQRCPDVAYRSHAHQEADTRDEFSVRVIQTRGWQLSTAFVERIAAGSLPEIGGIIQTNEAGRYDIRRINFEWKREEPWRTESVA